MSQSVWRDECAPIIRRILNDMPGASMKEKRKTLQSAYPFGMREYHPYRIWCDEINRQLGVKPPLGTFGVKPKAKEPPDPNQMSLIEAAEKE